MARHYLKSVAVFTGRSFENFCFWRIHPSCPREIWASGICKGESPATPFEPFFVSECFHSSQKKKLLEFKILNVFRVGFSPLLNSFCNVQYNIQFPFFLLLFLNLTEGKKENSFVSLLKAHTHVRNHMLHQIPFQYA